MASSSSDSFSESSSLFDRSESVYGSSNDSGSGNDGDIIGRMSEQDGRDRSRNKGGEKECDLYLCRGWRVQLERGARPPGGMPVHRAVPASWRRGVAMVVSYSNYLGCISKKKKVSFL